MRQEVKTLKFTCDDCKLIALLQNVIDEPGGCTTPNNWTYLVVVEHDTDGYGYAADLAGGLKIKHFCKDCSEKREIREVFK